LFLLLKQNVIEYSFIYRYVNIQKQNLWLINTVFSSISERYVNDERLFNSFRRISLKISELLFHNKWHLVIPNNSKVLLVILRTMLDNYEQRGVT